MSELNEEDSIISYCCICKAALRSLQVYWIDDHKGMIADNEVCLHCWTRLMDHFWIDDITLLSIMLNSHIVIPHSIHDCGACLRLYIERSAYQEL